MALQMTKMIAPHDKLKIKAPYSMDPIGVTIHETGNIATAMAEISYMIGNSSTTGYHIAVDDQRAVQGIPLNRNAFHSGDGSTGRGNRKTIAIETCYNWNGKSTTKNDSKYDPLYQKAVDNVVEMTAQLFIQYPQWGSPKSGVNLFQHNHHKSKNCPQRIREEGKWNGFVNRVNKRYQELKGGNKVVVKSLATNPDKEGRSTAFKRGDKVRLSSSAKKWHGSTNFDLESFKSTYVVDWLNADGTIYIKPVGADWGGNVLESDIEHARNNDIQKDDIIKLRDKAFNWYGGATITDGMKSAEYSVRYRQGNLLYIDNGHFRGLIYDWDAIKI